MKNEAVNCSSLAKFGLLELFRKLGVAAVIAVFLTLGATTESRAFIGSDMDGDGIDDVSDNCPDVANPGQENMDMDSAGDACDECPNDPAKIAPGICDCGTPDTDTDGDGTADCNDNCPGTPSDWPVTAFERLFWELDQSSFGIDLIEALCKEKSPLTPEQKYRLEKFRRNFCETVAVRALPTYVMLSAYEGRSRDNRSPAEIRFENMLFRDLLQQMLVNNEHPIILEWKKVASKEQLDLTLEKLNEKIGKKSTEKQLQDLTRRASGKFDENDIQLLKINTTGPHELEELPVPPMHFVDNLKYRVDDFIQRYNLTPAQKESARAILKDCRARMTEMRSSRGEILQQLWKEFVHAYALPQEGKTVKDAVRAYLRESQQIIRPAYDEMQSRLVSLLTEDQRKEVAKSVSKPRWRDLMELALNSVESELRVQRPCQP